ncbi:MAG: C10 family peptidase [Muribaculaceae bacterium]|nr:C10 family peptidase [Muribaculaceae bacterium]
MKFFNLLKLSSLALVLCMAAQMQAADIDLTVAQNVARSFLSRQVATGHMKAEAAVNLKLVKAEASVANPDAVDYYIFNTDKSYVVVAGDDLAPEILMYGVGGNLDLDKIPPAMKWLLNKYKYQIDGLKAGTMIPNNYSPRATAIAPLVTATWDQSAPYYNHTPTSGNTHAVTGCPATSLAMCFYKWKWPTTYPAIAAIPQSYYGLAADALPERAADWGNIVDHYGTWYDDNSSTHSASYTSAQADAVAWLMRYVGQACTMEYGTDASGANDPEILEACHTMGYTDAQLLTLNELVSSGWSYTNGPAQYTDAQWNEWMMAELQAGRPIEYLAYDCSSYQPAGHAFNVFGCDSNGKYYVNWGWSGQCNGYCTLHNFTTAVGATGQSGSYTFNYGEAMIIGIEPPAGALGPNIVVNPTSLAFEGFVGDTYTQTFTVTGYNLEGNITVTKQGSNYFTVSPTTITAANAANGVQVTVTYKPTEVGNANAYITLASTNAESVTVNVTGSAQAKVPTINVDPASLNFNANLSSTVSKTINVTGLFLTNNITVTLNDNNGVFSVSPTTITAANAANGVPVTVTFSSANEGNFNGSLTIASNGADTKTVQLTAKANDGGTASDPYLNIAKYETIDEAGATVSGMSSIYKYTEYPGDACAWLTVSYYGAEQADINQNWLDYEGNEKNAEGSWTANGIFQGSSSYFTGTAYYCNWNEAYQNFYVTNCTQVKQLSYNIQSSYNSGNVYPLKMEIYECTLNADGTLSAGTSTVDYKETQTTNQDEILSSVTLDPSKIYKVRIYNDYSRIYEIAFQTPIEGIETPVATEATEIGVNEFTANWNACDGATSYTLRVMPKPEAPAYTLLLTEGFSNCTTNGSNDVGNSLNNYMDNAGWTGSTVYTAVGGIRLGSSNAKGTLISPALDLTGSNGKVSIVYKAKTYNNDTNCNMTITCGSNSETVTIPNNTEAQYTQVLDCSASAGQNVTFATTANRKRVIITGIEIYSGDITTGSAKAAGEMLFPGITATSYTVTGLEPETTYIYDVKALFGNKESNWSNLIEVTTLKDDIVVTVPGDVNGDGIVSSVDVTVLYNFLLTGDTEYLINGDQDGDGVITTTDVTVVYNFLLGAQ